MEDLDERNGMKSKEQNEETKEQTEATEGCKKKGQPSGGSDTEGMPIEGFK